MCCLCGSGMLINSQGGMSIHNVRTLDGTNGSRPNKVHKKPIDDDDDDDDDDFPHKMSESFF